MRFLARKFSDKKEKKNIIAIYEAYINGKEKLIFPSIAPPQGSSPGEEDSFLLFHLPHQLLVLTHGEVYPCKKKPSHNRPCRLIYQKIVWFTFTTGPRVHNIFSELFLTVVTSEKSNDSVRQIPISLLVGPKFNNDILREQQVVTHPKVMSRLTFLSTQWRPQNNS